MADAGLGIVRGEFCGRMAAPPLPRVGSTLLGELSVFAASIPLDLEGDVVEFPFPRLEGYECEVLTGVAVLPGAWFFGDGVVPTSSLLLQGGSDQLDIGD